MAAAFLGSQTATLHAVPHDGDNSADEHHQNRHGRRVLVRTAEVGRDTAGRTGFLSDSPAKISAILPQTEQDFYERLRLAR